MKLFLAKLFPMILIEKMRDLFSWLKYFFYYRDAPKASKDRLLKSKTSSRAAIIATGPSINNFDFKNLEGVDCYSVSNFFLHESCDKINLKMHFFAPWHKPLDRNNYINWLQKADSELPKHVSIGLASQDFDLIKSSKLFRNRHCEYFFLVNRSYPRGSIKGPIMFPQTGPLMILPVLLDMGYEEIYLVGTDHNVIKDYGKRITHFYDKEKDIRINAAEGQCWSGIIEELENNLNVFKQYKSYVSIAKNVKIFRTSPNSWLDFFELRNFEKN